MTGDETPQPPPRDPGEPQAYDPLDDAAVYVLDALPEAERSEVALRLTGDAALQREVTRLRPVARRLVDRLALDDADEFLSDDLPELRVGPSPDLRDRILTAARAERDAAPSTPSQRAMHAPAATLQPRPVAPPATAAPTASVTPIRRISSTPLLAAGLLGVIAVGALLWALTAQNRLSDRDDEIAALQARVATAQATADNVAVRTNATAWDLNPLPDAPVSDNVSGEVFYSGRQEVLTLSISGLSPLESGRVYVLWYLGGQVGDRPMAAGEFIVDQEGNGFIRLTDVPPGYFDQVAITAEDQADEYDEPTAPILVLGTLSAAG